MPFVPHGHCLLWNPALVWSFVLSDCTIALSYFAIPLAVVYLIRKQRSSIPPQFITPLYGLVAFVLFCSFTHVLDIAEIWHPVYRFHAVIEAGTAIVSAATAIQFVPIARSAIEFTDNSVRDPLTDLYNRRYLYSTLERELLRSDRDENWQVSLVMLDLDYLKSWNDRYSHTCGDAVLKAIADTIKRLTRKSDLCGRISGDEIIILLPNTNTEQALVRAEEIRQAVAEIKIDYRGQVIDGITVSVGVATYPQHGNGVDELIHSVDKAMYESKQKGRNRVSAAG